jgi:hypothetical protein
MRVEINGGFRDEIIITHRYQEAFKRALPEDVEAVSRETVRKIKSIMPVDTGRARATWGIFTPQHIVYFTPRNLPMPDESIWEVSGDGLSITQGADLRDYNYIDELNAGSSKQAPAMFLDVAAEQAGDELAKRIDRRTRDAL